MESPICILVGLSTVSGMGQWIISSLIPFLQYFPGIANKGESIDLSISFRVPSSHQPTGKVEFYFNDSQIATLDAQPNWVNHKLAIPGKYCKKGINELIIHWPIPETVDRPTNMQIGDSKAIINQMYYVFGQISHFKAAGVKKKVEQEENILQSIST